MAPNDLQPINSLFRGPLPGRSCARTTVETPADRNGNRVVHLHRESVTAFAHGVWVYPITVLLVLELDTAAGRVRRHVVLVRRV